MNVLIKTFRTPVARVVMVLVVALMVNVNYVKGADLKQQKETSYHLHSSDRVVLNTSAEFTFQAPVFTGTNLLDLYMEIFLLDIPSARILQAKDHFFTRYVRDVFYVFVSTKAP